jgi:hypothetical protein
MKNIFISKIDNKKFNTQEELVNHLISNYSMIDSNGGGCSIIFKKLQEEFPFAKINVTINHEKEYGEYLVKMIWKSFNADFNFYIGEFNARDSYYTSFKTVDDAINYYRRFITSKDEIIDKLKIKYSPESIVVDRMFEGYLNSNNSISFQMEIGNQTYHGIYEFGDVNEFINSFNAHFDYIFEGEVKYIDSDSYYEHQYLINGVPVETVLKRAKKIRLEILESK